MTLSRTATWASRAFIGVLAGTVGTTAMTAVMRRLHRNLPPTSQYPLPPREIVDETFPGAPDDALPSLTMLSHFGYGAVTGAIFALFAPHRGPAVGAAYGIGVWVASYLGWIPASGILKPATRHPRERNALMIAAHVVWGGAMALTIRELECAKKSIFR